MFKTFPPRTQVRTHQGWVGHIIVGSQSKVKAFRYLELVYMSIDITSIASLHIYMFIYLYVNLCIYIYIHIYIYFQVVIKKKLLRY
jgi:hypothetical protein